MLSKPDAKEKLGQHDGRTTCLAGPKKRKRRTAGGGAQDDCFACRQRASPCDRQRPYCSQCIQLGKECSGYKTTLTWGVGVASRGKLRGMSLPVTKSVSQERESRAKAESAKTQGYARKSSSTSSSPDIESGTDAATRITRPPCHQTTSSPTIIEPPNTSTTTASSRTRQNSYWTMHSTPGSLLVSTDSTTSTRPISHSVRRLQTSFSPQDEAIYSGSASSTGSYFDADYLTSIPYPPHFGSPTKSESDYMNVVTGQEFTTDLPSLDEQFSSKPSSRDVSYITSASADNASYHLIHAQQFEDQSLDTELEELSTASPLNGDAFTLFIDTTFSNPFPGIPHRTRYLIQYYDVNICPFLVAVDGPQNPYRQQIIQMAVQHEGLQHALAALAVNNLRMRMLLPEGPSEGCNNNADHRKPTNVPSNEESLYKKLSVDRLNQQLVDPTAAQDESVLATILVLCLFHVCDSGFSKFRTQIAGVQKLLSLRPAHQRSLFASWVEMFFMWFDVMTAAVNDREMEMTGTNLDMLDYTLGLGALEQFSGCDGRLFKLIARLNRLNLLAQGRPVTGSGAAMHEATNDGRPAHAIYSLPPSSQFQGGMKRSLNSQDYENLDGNGWYGHVSSDSSQTWPSHLPPPPDARHQFWSEWHDVRSRLAAWHIDTSIMSWPAFGLESNRLGSEQGEMIHISEAFRHSALLYTERLAHPLLPSASYRFQQHVSRALFHITALPVTSCVNKFLLWPLFITGTECVDAGHRATVRLRCIEIQRESGFYNNLSGLEVLERVWADVDIGQSDASEMKARRRDSESAGVGPLRQAFRWRIAMDRADGEYLII